MSMCMLMSQKLEVKQCLICNVCQRTWKWPNLKDKLQESPLNTGRPSSWRWYRPGVAPPVGNSCAWSRHRTTS